MEFALVLPLLVLLVLGGIDWGVYLHRSQVVTNAAREGARAGAVAFDEDVALSEAEAAAENYLERGLLETVKATVSATRSGDSVSVEVEYEGGAITGFTKSFVPDVIRARAEMAR